jgi:hypothetical protein
MMRFTIRDVTAAPGPNNQIVKALGRAIRLPVTSNFVATFSLLAAASRMRSMMLMLFKNRLAR